MKEWIKDRPWIWIILWFMVVFAVWGWFIPYSHRIQMTPVPVESETNHE
ncbi:MAG: hypothetical protein V4507_02200 [Verrucomicrobiota bacterium]